MKLCKQEDKVAEYWEKEFNKLMDATETSSVELFYMTEVRYEFLEQLDFPDWFPVLFVFFVIG